MSPSRHLPAAVRWVFEGLNNGHIDIPHSLFVNQGGWQYADNRFTTQAGAVLQWSGRTSNQPILTFQTGPGMGIVRIAWDEKVEEYSLGADASGQVILRTILPVSAWSKWIYSLLSLAFFTSMLCLLLGWILSLPRPLAWHAATGGVSGLNMPSQSSFPAWSCSWFISQG